MGTPAARTMDKVTHPLPGQLMPGPGSFNVLIGNMPAWRGLPAAQAAALQAAQQVADAALQVAQAATIAAAPTPAGPAVKAAEIAARTAASAALGGMMQGLAASSMTPSGGMPDTHVCATLIPPPVPHGPGMVIDGSPTVLTNGLPQCAVGDKVLEAIGGPDPILMGCFNVLVGKSASGGGGGGGGIMDALKAALASLIAKAVDALDKAMDTIAKVAAFVKNLVRAVIDGLANFVERLGRAIVNAVTKALIDFATRFAQAMAALKPKPGAALQDAVKNTNPHKSVLNCGHIIDAAAARISGKDPNAVAPAGQDGSFTDIESRFDTKLNWGSNFQSAYDAVKAGGPGTMAIVGIGYSGGSSSHVVLLANDNGQVGIVEGQDWGAGNPPEVIADVARANTRYNSDGGSNIGWGIVGSNP